MTLTYKFRMYPNKPVREKLDFALDICRQTYNHLLSGLDERFTKNELQNYLLDLKVVFPEMNNIHSKVLQMENQRLCLCGCGKEVKKGNKYINGHNHPKHTEEFKKRLSKRQLGENNVSKRLEVREKMKEAKLINPTNYWLGKHRDSKFMKYVGSFSKGMSGKTHTQETKDNLSILKSKQTSEYIASGKLFNGNSKYRGHFWSDKNNKSIYYQSFYEQRCLEILELNANVLKFDRCNIILEYIKNNKIKRYIPDFEIEYINGDKEIIEVKPLKLIKFNNEKIKKLEEYCLQHNIFYSIYSEEQLNINTKVWKQKAENAGCKIVKIDPKNTTKQCSNCGNLQKMPLWIRTYKCSSCGFEIDRDLNSAINIKTKFIGSERANVENNSSTQIEQGLSMKQEAITSTGVRL